jgi:hypothetical protein
MFIRVYVHQYFIYGKKIISVVEIIIFYYFRFFISELYILIVNKKLK